MLPENSQPPTSTPQVGGSLSSASTTSMASTSQASTAATSAPPPQVTGQPNLVDPKLLFSKDIMSMSFKEQMVHIIQQNNWNFHMNSKLDSKVEENLESIVEQKEQIEVLRLNQQCIAQQLMECQNQFSRTHTFIENKADEILKDTQEALREDRNVFLWELEREALDSYSEAKDEADAVNLFAFDMVSSKLKNIEPIDIRAVKLPEREGDKAEHFRMKIIFACAGDANKFRLRLNSEGMITLRRGMSMMTRTLCSKYKELAKKKNEMEPPESNFEYRTKFQFSIVKHSKGNPDDIHGISHSLNPSEPYSEIKLRPGVNLVPFPKKKGENTINESTPASNSNEQSEVIFDDMMDAQDIGDVNTPFAPPNGLESRESLSTPSAISKKRGRDDPEQDGSGLGDLKRHRDDNRGFQPRGKPPTTFRGHPPRGNPHGGFYKRQNFNDQRGLHRGGVNDGMFTFQSYRRGNSYKKNNGYFDRRRGQNGGFQKRFGSNWHRGQPRQNYRDYDYDQDFSSNYTPIGGVQRGNGPGRPRGSRARGSPATGSRLESRSNVNSNSNVNVGQNMSENSESSANSDVLNRNAGLGTGSNPSSGLSDSSSSNTSSLSQKQQDWAKQVPVSFASFDGKHISKVLATHQKPKLAMKITQQQEELNQKQQQLEAANKEKLELLRRLHELEKTGSDSRSDTPSGSSSAASVESSRA